jgi:Sel1 repeat/Cellulose synthase subunit D
MAPLDTLSGESFLAEFETISGRGGAIPGAAAATPPERRAVNWANALAKIADEVQVRQGRRSAESLLRTVGARISRDLLTPLPESRDAFEPAINRVLSSLDWGWVAISEREDAIVFEHRAPWPFENRTTLLPSVLEGFFTDTLRRLSGDQAVEVKGVGKRNGALIFEWHPAAEEPAPEATTEAETTDPEPRLELEPADASPEGTLPDDDETAESPSFDAPRIPLGPAFAKWRDQHRVTDAAPRSRHQASALMVAAIVFFGLFGLGLLTSGGDIAGAVLHRITGAFGISAASSATPGALERRANSGDTRAQIALALNLAGANHPDFDAAAGWLRRAATAGSAKAQYDLGVMYEHGVGVKHDPVEAAILFMNAAASGLANAQYRLGVAYEKGLGVPQNGTDAAMWYERAARQGIRGAQTALGRLYASGAGIPADPVAAYAWYRLADENGDATARGFLTPLWAKMTVAQRTVARQRALALIADVGARDAKPAHHGASIEELIAQAS